MLRENETTPPQYQTLAAAHEVGVVVVYWGAFINTAISLLIAAFSVFLIVKSISKVKRERGEAPAEPLQRICFLRKFATYECRRQRAN